MKIAVISGSARNGRRSHFFAMEAMNRLKQMDEVQTWMFDVKEENLPLLYARYHHLDNPDEQLERLHDELASSDAFLVVTPEYNGSYSGALKNSMDYFYDVYNNKPFGIVAVSAGGKGGIRAAGYMQQYILVLQGINMPIYQLTPNAEKKVQDGKIVDEEYLEQMDDFLQKFVKFARKHRKD